ncbi:midasin, partial [Caerostris extrusa]
MSTFANTRIATVLLEKVAACIYYKEPVLLVGETGTGKTSIVQHLAELTNRKLTVINMSQQRALVKAMKDGEWLLLDEINLAEAETLECLAGVLDNDDSLILLEKGDSEPVKRHPDFRIFACMNPATDVGKKIYQLVLEAVSNTLPCFEIWFFKFLSLCKGDHCMRTKKWSLCQHSWILDFKGDQEPEEKENYIFTETVRKIYGTWHELSVQGVSLFSCKGNIMWQTSLIQYLAKATGNVCVRVNNHEHTDIQEYVQFAYTTDEKEICILVEAMRNGYWVILDELNLAPTEVMEALNR